MSGLETTGMNDEAVAWPHLFPHVTEVTTMREVKKSFEPGYDPKLNWLFIGTSWLYGSKLTLDQIEEVINGESEFYDAINGRYYATVLIVHPRIPAMKYGDILVNLDDVEWLRGIVEATIVAVNEDQEENV